MKLKYSGINLKKKYKKDLYKENWMKKINWMKEIQKIK